jgi:hypothetical protein
MMSAMPKGRGDQAQRASRRETVSPRRKRRIPSDPNEAFVRAFADALNDILEEELRLSA